MTIIAFSTSTYLAQHNNPGFLWALSSILGTMILLHTIMSPITNLFLNIFRTNKKPRRSKADTIKQCHISFVFLLSGPLSQVLMSDIIGFNSTGVFEYSDLSHISSFILISYLLWNIFELTIRKLVLKNYYNPREI